ncbi:MAG TPA: DUF4132 domain-containing protein [Longimicrobium sp.]|nr:DUF4132 domain-containing protein [Longimicrobium sp.]
MGLLDLLGLGRLSASRTSLDGFVVPGTGPLADAHAAVEAYLAEAAPRIKGYVFNLQPRDTENGRRILDLPPDEQAAVAMAALERAVWTSGQQNGRDGLVVRQLSTALLSDLLRRRLPLAPEQVAELLEVAPRLSYDISLKSLLTHAEHACADPAAREILRPVLERQHARVSSIYGADNRELAGRISELLAGQDALLLDAEPWADRIAAEVQAMDEPARGRWLALVRHLRDATSAKASARWLKEARRLVGQVGADEFRGRALAWLAGVREGADTQVSPRNGDLLRGIVWCLAEGGDDDTARALGDLALVGSRKIPSVGVRSLKAMNACVAALGDMAGAEPMAQLSRLRARVKYAQAQGIITAALRGAAERRGVGMDELEELVVPTFGMDEPGVLREEIGDCTAELRIVGTAEVETVWVRADGKRQKSPPTAVKEAHGDEVKELKKTAGEMEQMLLAQRDRIERLPMAGRVLAFDAWRERYLDHPLLAPLSRRLIWRFETGARVDAGAWRDGRLVDAGDAPLEGLAADTRVSLWHPIAATVDEVRGWRGWLERHGVTQPFKQAHREVYLLTDAERRTGTYSNRFAAHVLRQHQFAALAKGRGWQYQLLGCFDNFSIPTLRLASHGLRVEYLVEPIVRDEDLQGSGISRYISTDQVRFFAEGNRLRQLELAEVPPLVLSETMRDVDLFVGVASVGADPDWADRGAAGPMGTYWHTYSFGELSQTAETRREVLERLVPRLKIARVCSLEGRFLVVRGSLRTYKIHLGSGNILMEPNDQYLCIVPDRGGAAARGSQGLVLPFEGDSTLSVILSKAFLLADDTKITDPTITRQIWPGR